MNTWSFGDGSTGFGFNPTHTYGAIGTYQVNLMVDNGCGTDQITKQVNITTMSVSEPQKDDGLKLFPNPSAGSFRIEMPDGINLSGAELRIYDMTGRMVMAEVVPQSDQTLLIRLTEARPGMYLVTVQGEKSLYRERIIVR
jgi:PKD repeat protein